MIHPELERAIVKISSRVSDTTEGGAQLHQQVEERARAGETWAQVLSDRALAEGYRRIYVATVNSLNGRYEITVRATKRSVRRAFARPLRDDSGASTGAWQPDFWMAWPWEEIEGEIARLQKQEDQLMVNRSVMRYAINDLRPRCPQARSPLEACHILGLDPDEYMADIAL